MPSMISISPPLGQFPRLVVQKAGHDPQFLGKLVMQFPVGTSQGHIESLR